MLIAKDKEDFLELYREYIGDFDDTYEENQLTDEELVHQFECQLDLIGCDMAEKVSKHDYARVDRYYK